MRDLFETQRNCLRLMGHTFRTEEDEKSPRLQNWRTMSHIASLLLVVSAQWPMIDYSIYHIDDLTLATASLSICLTNVLTVIKISTYLLYHRKFVNLMAQFNKMFEQLTEPAAKPFLIAANRIAMNLVKVYYYLVTATGVYFIMGPIIKIILAKLTQKAIVLDLPMPMRFAFDFESTPGYELCYVYIALVTVIVVFHASAIDGLFLSFTINLRGHFQALQYFITSNSYRKSDEELQQDISSYIQYHVLLLKLSENVRQIYKPIVFGQFMMTSIQVCLIVYQLVTNLDRLMVLITYCTFLSAILLQLFIYCYGGEILKNESGMVGTAVQLSSWYNLSPKNRKMLCQILQRSQRETVIKAGFYEASLTNFMLIIKAGVSYITLIQSIE